MKTALIGFAGGVVGALVLVAIAIRYPIPLIAPSTIGAPPATPPPGGAA